MLSKFTRESIAYVSTPNTNTNPEEIEFSKLECCCLQIRIIDKLRPSFTFISQLYLDHNALKSLNGIEQFQNLQILSLNFNFIGSFRELKKIQNNFFLKELSLVGNPVDSDPNCNFQDLKNHLFKNLVSFNSVSGLQTSSKNAKIFTSPSEINHTKTLNNKAWQLKTQTDQDLTERVRGSFVTDKLNTSFKTKKSHDLSKVLEFNEPMSPPLKSRENAVKSTTLNQYSNKSAHFHPLKYNYSDELQRQGREMRIRNQQFLDISLNEGVFIAPFVEEYEIKDIEKQGQESILNSRKRRFVYEQLQGQQFQEERGEEENNFYREVAYKMLEQQKQAIAEAFYLRSLKQKIFYTLKTMKSLNPASDLNQKRKALSAIKLFSTLQQIF